MHLSEFSKKKLSPFTSTNKLLCNILILKCFHFIFVQFILFFRILRIFWPKKWGCPDLPDIPRNYTPEVLLFTGCFYVYLCYKMPMGLFFGCLLNMVFILCLLLSVCSSLDSRSETPWTLVFAVHCFSRPL